MFHLMSINTCFFLLIRNCLGVKQLSAAVSKRKDRQIDKKKIQSATSSIIRQLDQAKMNKQWNLVSLEESSRQIEAVAENFRGLLHQLVDNMVNRTLEGSNKIVATFKSTVQSEMQEYSKLQKDLSRLADKIDNKGITDEVQRFVCGRKCEEQLSKAEIILQASTQNYSVNFSPDKQLEHYLENFKMAGEFTTDPIIGTGEEKPYNMERIQDLWVDAEGDKQPPNVTDICQISDGRYVLVDQGNTKLKLFNEKFELKASCKVSQHPFNVCQVGEAAVAISVSHQQCQEIHFVNVGSGSLKVSRKFSTKDQCYGLSHFNGLLYASSLDAIYVYGLSGRFMKKVYEDRSGHQTVKRFAISGDRQKIYLTNPTENSLITINTTGQVLATLAFTHLQNPTGICVARNGNVVVCALESKMLIQVNEAGTKELSSTTRDDKETVYQQSLWCNLNNSFLLVGQTGSKMALFKLCA